MNNFTAVTPIEQKALNIGQVQTTYTGNDLDWSQVDPYGEFYSRPLFVDNCKTCDGNKKNALGDIIGSLGGVAQSYFQSQSSENAAAIAQAQAQAAQYQVQQQQAQNVQQSLQNQGAVAKIKAYIVPISIVGGLAIVGIATYFIFKKKKIN